MNIVQSLKASRTKNKIPELEIEFSCLFCVGKKGKLPLFYNIESLIKHLEQCHRAHFLYKKYRHGLKKLHAVIDFVAPKIKEECN